MTRRWKQLDLPGRPAPAPGLDDVLGGAQLVGRRDPSAEVLRRLHEATGRAANDNGREGEHWVERHHAIARSLGLVSEIVHAGEPGVPHVKGGRVQFDRRGRLLKAVVDRAPPDYLGGAHDGRWIVVEAKHRGQRLYRDAVLPDGRPQRNAIAAHQVKFLRKVAMTPALVLLVAEFDRARETVRVAVPFAIADARWASPRGGAPSLGPDELGDWRVDPDCYLARFIDPPA